VVRFYARQAAKRLVLDRLLVADKYYNEVVLGSIWEKIFMAKERRSQSFELRCMEIEDDLKHKWDYMCRLQLFVSSMDALIFGIRRNLGKLSIYLPRMKVRPVPVKGPKIYKLMDKIPKIPELSAPMVMTNVLRPSYTFSWASLRELELKKDPKRRLPLHVLVKAAKKFPFFDVLEGLVFDADVNLFLSPHIRDIFSERWRNNRMAVLTARESEEKEKAALTRRVNMAEKSQKAVLYARAKAISNGTAHLLQEKENLSRDILRTQLAIQKNAAKKTFETHLQSIEDDEDSTFEQKYYASNNGLSIRGLGDDRMMKRRKSIGDPCDMYNRVTSVDETLRQRAVARRRLSLPPKLSKYTPPTQDHSRRVEGIKRSLSVYFRRLRLLNGFLDPRYEAQWSSVSKSVRLKRLQQTLSYAWLNPRLPKEMLQMLSDVGRRRTIGEPERLSKQLFIMFESRNAFAQLRIQSRTKDRVYQRRRSFDMGEGMDSEADITNSIGYQFEEVFELPTMGEIRASSVNMGSRMLNSGFILKKGRKKIITAVPAARSHESRALRSSANVPMTVTGLSPEATLIAQKEMAAKLEAEQRGLLQFDAKRFVRNGKAVQQAQQAEEGLTVDLVLDHSTMDVEQVWEEHFGDDGHGYYYNPTSGESSWDTPTGEGVQISSQFQDTEGTWYWYNNITGESTWV